MIKEAATAASFYGRSTGIRTRGLLDPNQARYQTSPCPDSQNIIMEKSGCVKWLRVIFPILENSLIQEANAVAYKIIYHSEIKKRYRKNIFRRACLTFTFFISFLWFVSVLWPEGMELIKMLIIPGNPDTTLQAAEVFAMELNCGVGLTHAINNFITMVRMNGN